MYICPIRSVYHLVFINCLFIFYISITLLFTRTSTLSKFLYLGSISEFLFREMYIILCIYLNEASGIIHNGLYSVYFVRMNCSSENITVLGYTQFFDARILQHFFYTIHSMSVLGKEAKSWFYIKYLMHTHVLVLLIKKGCQMFKNACAVWLIKSLFSVLTAINKVSGRIVYMEDHIIISTYPCFYDILSLTWSFQVPPGFWINDFVAICF